jgi:hypothetical protein
MRGLIEKVTLKNVRVQFQVDDGRGHTTGRETVRVTNARPVEKVMTDSQGIGFFSIPRPTNTKRLDLYWEILPQEGIVFLATGATPLMTTGRPQVLVHQEILIDPNQLPGVEDIFLQGATRWLARLEPWSYLVLLVFLALVSKLGDGLLWLIKRPWAGRSSRVDGKTSASR